MSGQSGSVRQRGATWTAYWFVTDAEGRRVQKSKGGFAKKGEARSHLNTVLADLQAGTHIEPTKVTLAQYLRDSWLPTLDLRPSTVASYKHHVEAWIIPDPIGGMKLAAITPKAVSDFHGRLRGADRRDGRGKIGARTTQYVATTLGKALRDAVALGMLPRSPAAGVKRPTAARAQMRFWTGEQARQFLASTATDTWHAAWVLALTTGLRRGELLGLRWRDIDLEAGRLAVTQTRIAVGYDAQSSAPKTDRSRRSIALDPDTVAVLRSHRKRQVEDRLAWGEAWVDSGLVFVREDGSPIHPQRTSQAFERAVKKAGVPMIRFHDLRHTMATLALKAGVHPKVVQERLGHSSIAITLDTYSHVIEGMQEAAAASIAGSIFGATEAGSG